MQLTDALNLIMDHMRSVVPVWPTNNEFAAYALSTSSDDANLPLPVREALDLAQSNFLATLDEIYSY